MALPIFPVSHPTSIFGGDELNFCVRYGNRWTLTPINTNDISVTAYAETYLFMHVTPERLVTRGRVELPFAA